MSPFGFAARLRGVASGLLTATLAVAAHGYGGAEPPTGAAIVALFILGAGDRLCRVVSRVVRVAVRVVCPPAAPQGRPLVRRAEQPLRSALLLAASVSDRGPPVGLAC